MRNGRLHVLGVRHHSPICAKLVKFSIEQIKPKIILIEGPSEMNERMSEFDLDHKLPIAVFSFDQSKEKFGKSKSIFTPFCEYSPEWQAIKSGAALKIERRFIDLPACAIPYEEISENRYADGWMKYQQAIVALCQQFQCENFDQLWDHLFEGQSFPDLEKLWNLLDRFFIELRNLQPACHSDLLRESFMSKHINAALSHYNLPTDQILVICGGFHASALLNSTENENISCLTDHSADGSQSYIIPWSYMRLDAFNGYASGMPSPAFYQNCFAKNSQFACEQVLKEIALEFRQEKIDFSTADFIAVYTMAKALQELRGHDNMHRKDLLDGIISSLLKDVQDVQPPWVSNKIVDRTHPLLKKVMKIMSGNQKGEISADTPLPPIVENIYRKMSEHQLSFENSKDSTLKLDLTNDQQRQQSQILHQLLVLSIPGIMNISRNSLQSEQNYIEVWQLKKHDLQLAAMIEAAQWGVDLKQASGVKLATSLFEDNNGIRHCVDIYVSAIRMGVVDLGQVAMRQIEMICGKEKQLSDLGYGLSILHELYRADYLFEVKNHSKLFDILKYIYSRILWLLEHFTSCQNSEEVEMIKIFADVRYFVNLEEKQIDYRSFVDLCVRLISNSDVSYVFQGAACGCLWSMPKALFDQEKILVHLKKNALPQRFGLFLSGLFELARVELSEKSSILDFVKKIIIGFSDDDFLLSLPYLRLAFSFFPPKERAMIAKRMFGGQESDHQLTHLLSLPYEAEVLISLRTLDANVDQLMKKYGLV